MSAIRAGDLVYVARENPCGCPDRVGHVFVVTRVRLSAPVGYCASCGREWRPNVFVAEGHPSGGTVAVPRLKRFNPLTDPESTEHREELTV